MSRLLVLIVIYLAACSVPIVIYLVYCLVIDFVFETLWKGIRYAQGTQAPNKTVPVPQEEEANQGE